MFPADVAFEIASPGMWTTPAFPEEESAVSKAVPKRRAEFRAGRACARAALSHLGVRTPGAILKAEDRRPVWPAGYVGSISHCRDFCMAAVARASAFRGLGLDVEPPEPLPGDVHELILVPRDDVDGTLITAFGEPVCHRLIFSAKESIYKCINPVLRIEFEFDDVQVAIRPEDRSTPSTGRFEASPTDKAPSSLNPLKPLHGRYVVTETHLVTSLLWPAAQSLQP